MSISRRRFVRNAALSLLAAPFVQTLGGRARAAESDVAKRLVVFFSPNGSVLKHWRPSGSGTSFNFPAGSILEPLAAVKDHVIVVDGLDFKGTSNHEGGMSHMLRGGGDISIDQFVAAQIGAQSRFSSLEFGVQTSAWGGSVQTRMSYNAAGEFVPPNDDPAGAYKRIFGAAMPGGDGADATLMRRSSVLDLLKDELTDLQGQIGYEERPKLEAHLDAIRRMEGSLAPAAGGACNPGTPFGGSAQDNDSFPAAGRAQMDLLIASLSCDLTRVASLQWSHTVSPTVFSWLNISEGHHALSHMDDGNMAGVAQFVAAERWYAEQFAYLVGRLAELPDPDGEGSLLDTTVVVWAKEMGDSRLHVCTEVPFVLAGKAGGRLKTGQYLKVTGEAHNRLLVSIAQAMGLNIPTFGDPAHGTGPLRGLLA